MKIYLAGGMGYGWQDSADFGQHQLLDPRTWQCEDPVEYTRRDLSAINEADVVIAFMRSQNPSGFGLSVELGYAFASGKRILFVDKIKDDWRSKYFGMHRAMATSVHASLEDAVAAL